jgi:hypothetical protein
MLSAKRTHQELTSGTGDYSKPRKSRGAVAREVLLNPGLWLLLGGTVIGLVGESPRGTSKSRTHRSNSRLAAGPEGGSRGRHFLLWRRSKVHCACFYLTWV